MRQVCTQPQLPHGFAASLVVGLIVAAVTVLAGCGEEPPAKPTFDATAMLANLADNHFGPRISGLDAASKAVLGDTKKWCAALGKSDESDRLKAAQASFTVLMLQWQAIELMKIGPLAANSGALRDDIYSWPTASACAVDQGVAKLRNEPNFPLKDALPNWRGLDALEYLLWAPTLDSQCPDTAKPPNWDGLAEADRKVARCNYADLVAANVGGHLASLADAWAAGGGDYGTKLKTIGAGGAFATAAKAENAISDALFYLDAKTKDGKLGAPAGVTANVCGTKDAPCQTAAESRWAHNGKAYIRANLDAFEQLFTGVSASGKAGDSFSKHLASVGQDKLNDAILSYIAAAKTAVDAIPGSVHAAAEADRDAVVKAYEAVKKITDILKTEFLLAVSLDIPDEAAGDND